MMTFLRLLLHLSDGGGEALTEVKIMSGQGGGSQWIECRHFVDVTYVTYESEQTITAPSTENEYWSI